MSRKRNKKNPIKKEEKKSLSANELSQKLNSFPKRSGATPFLSSTNSGNEKPTHEKNVVEDDKDKRGSGETQANFYQEKYHDEKFNSVYSEIDNKTNKVEAKLTIDIANLKTTIEEKFSTFIKWGIALSIAIISIPITVFMFMMNGASEKIESNLELKFEKRIIPIEEKIGAVEKQDSVIFNNKKMPNPLNK